MLRVTKLTDYGIVLMTYLAMQRYQLHSAHAIADAVKVPLPTVRKVLKSLSHGELLRSERGTAGGYSLSRAPEYISVAEIIAAIEGPIALTECVSSESHCEQETHCNVQTNWTRINNAVFHALDEVKLSDMLTTQNIKGTNPIKFYPSATAMDNPITQNGDS